LFAATLARGFLTSALFASALAYFACAFFASAFFASAFTRGFLASAFTRGFLASARLTRTFAALARLGRGRRFTHRTAVLHEIGIHEFLRFCSSRFYSARAAS